MLRETLGSKKNPQTEKSVGLIGVKSVGLIGKFYFFVFWGKSDFWLWSTHA